MMAAGSRPHSTNDSVCRANKLGKRRLKAIAQLSITKSGPIRTSGDCGVTPQGGNQGVNRRVTNHNAGISRHTMWCLSDDSPFRVPSSIGLK